MKLNLIEILLKFLGNFGNIFQNAHKRLSVLIQVAVYAALCYFSVLGTVSCFDKSSDNLGFIVIGIFLLVISVVLAIYTVFSVIYLVLMLIACIIDLCHHANVGLNILMLFLIIIVACGVAVVAFLSLDQLSSTLN